MEAFHAARGELTSRARSDGAPSRSDGPTTGYRIALVAPSLKIGGLERIVHDLALVLTKRGHDCQVFALQDLGPYAEDLDRAGIPVTNCRERAARIRGLPLQFLRALTRFRPTIIHAHTGTWMAAVIAKLLLRSPRLLFTDHGRYPPEPAYRAFVERQFFYRHTDHLVAVSRELATYLTEFLRLETPPQVIENGIEIGTFQEPDKRQARALRAEWGIEDDDVLAISVGRLAPVKNHHGMLIAMARAVEAAPHLRLAILGAGRLLNELNAQIGSLGLQERVLLLGARSDVAHCLSAADIFVSASLTEGLPVALLEALAAGLPVVTTAVGGIPEALGEPSAGVLVPSGDMERLSRELVALAHDPDRRAALSARARRRAHRFSLDGCADRYCEVYDELAEGTARSMTTASGSSA